MSELNKRLAAITGFGFRSNQIPSSIAEFHQPNSGQVSTRKSGSCVIDTRTAPYSVTLDPDSILSDEALSPYWSEHCAAKQSMWWLPHQTASQGRGTHSSVTSSNFQEDQSSFWKRVLSPNNSTCERSLRISLPSATPCMASVQVKGTRKIRVFPKNPTLLLELIRQQRRAYNLAIARFREADQYPDLRKSPDLKQTALRATIRDFVRSEVLDRSEMFRSADCDEAINAAFRTRDAIIKRRTKGEKCGFSFRSIKDIRKQICIQKLSPRFVSANFELTEPMPDEAWGKLTTIVFERGQWFVCAQKHITTIGQNEIQVRSIVAIDPGVRTFATAYSTNHAAKYGNNLYSEKVFPLLLKLDVLAGYHAKAEHPDWKRHYQKCIDRLAIRIRNMIDDLHKRVAYDLVQNFDVILLPFFKTKEMSAKSERKIRTKTVRYMLGLAHYRFQLRLKWMCQKYGKRLVMCNEAYTSKTVSWTGKIIKALGGAESISDNGIKVDRDINGARGIMLRALYGNLGRSQAANANVALVAG